MDCRRAGGHQEKPLQKIRYPTGPILRVALLYGYRLLANLLGYALTTPGLNFGLEPFFTMLAVNGDPALDRLRTDPELLAE